MALREETFDFVIVGGGTAGLVLARRLSEGGKYTVCVLEAGNELDRTRPEVAMPMMVPALLAPTSDVVWPYESTPQKQLNGQRIYLPAGRTGGGCSTINFCLWIRGNAVDYTRLAEISGDPSWSFQSLLPYFRKAENYHDVPGAKTDTTIHGNSGPVHVAPFAATGKKWKFGENCAKGYAAAGFRSIPDFNGGDTLGYGELAASVYFPEGGRQPSVTYISEKPSTLSTFYGKTVAKVNFEGKRATGATTTSGEVYRARKEVLVCAGGLRSPAILQLSGVGPKELLTPLGIPVVADLPGVGENLWDHPTIHMHWRIKASCRGGTLEDLKIPGKLQEEMAIYQSTGTGLLSWHPFDCTAFKNHSEECASTISSDPALTEKARSFFASKSTPHSQYLFAHAYLLGDRFDLGSDSYVTISPIIATPSSRGTVRIKSADPTEWPDFNTNYLATATDRALMKAALKTAADVMNSAPWQEVVDEEVNFATGIVGFTEDALENKINQGLSTICHYAGTCAMAAPDSKDVLPVVNSKCQVYGVTNLRVIDMSVFPTPISSNTQAPTYVLAEKIADEILKAHAT